MMKQIKQVWAILLLALLALPSMAQDSKIGFVNLDRIMRESGPAVRALRKIDKEFQPRENELKKLSELIRTRQSDLDKSGLTLAETERRNKEREIVKLQQDYSRLLREYREDSNVRRNEELSGINERIFNTIQQIAAAEKYDAVLQEALYINPKLDITDKVLKALADK